MNGPHDRVESHDKPRRIRRIYSGSNFVGPQELLPARSKSHTLPILRRSDRHSPTGTWLGTFCLKDCRGIALTRALKRPGSPVRMLAAQPAGNTWSRYSSRHAARALTND